MNSGSHRPDRPAAPLPPRAACAWTAEGIALPGPGAADPETFLAGLFALAPVTMMRRMPGRETFAWPGRSDLVIKRTWGGEARDWWYEFLGPDAPRSPGRREAECLLALAADGVRVPQALAWAEEGGAARHPRLGGRDRRSAVVMERVPHDETVRARLARATPDAQRALLDRLAEVVTRLHAAGWYHRDLYLQHFVLPAAEPDDTVPVLLDVGRARKEGAPRERWFVKDLAALLHSAPATVPRPARQRFLARWLAARGITAASARRRWGRAVLHKARRLEAHAPRHVDARGGADR